MAEPGRGVERELEEGVRRILGALERIPPGRIEAAASQISRAAETAAAGIARAIEKTGDRPPTREERKLAKRLKEEEDASLPQAFVMGGAAIVAAFIGATQPHLFWLFFVGFGFAMGAADIFTKVRSRERRQAEEERARAATAIPAGVVGSAPPAAAAPPPPPPAPESPALAAIAAREKRVDGICDRLLAELGEAPPLVRELLRNPEETVTALRAASRELARRERGLRASLTEEEGERLLGERSGLAARVDTTTDAVVKERLEGALSALDAQLAHRAELATAAARIEAEGTRILYSLESLRAQVLRAFAADAAAAEVTRESLKGSLESLSAEIDAVATALEEVHGVGAPASSSAGPTAAARAAALQRTGLALLLALAAAAPLSAEPVAVPGGPAAIRRILALGERRPDRDFFLDVQKVFLSGAGPRAAWDRSEARRKVADFVDDLAEWRKEQGCPALLSAKPEGWKKTRSALAWLGWRVRGEGEGFTVERRDDPEARRRQAFLGLLGASADDVVARLAAGEEVRVDCGGGNADLPFGLAAWREVLGLDAKALTAENAFLHFVRDVRASRMLVALHGVDAGTREELRAFVGAPGGYAGWKLLFDDGLDGFSFSPDALEMKGGKLLLPGGDAAAAAWEAVVGAPPSEKEEFVRRFFGGSSGKAAYVADALRPLPPEAARAFVVGKTPGGEPTAERFERLYGAIGKVGRSYGASQRDSWDLAHLAPFLASREGEIAVPGGAAAWLEALDDDDFPADEAGLARLLAAAAARKGGVDELLVELLGGEVDGPGGNVPAAKPFVVVSGFAKAHPVLDDPGTVLLLVRGVERFLSGYAILEDLPLEEPVTVRRYLFTLHRLDTNGTDRPAELRAGLFQASVELLGALRRSGALSGTKARELFAALLDQPLFARAGTAPEAGIADFHRWLFGGLVSALREEEARFLASRGAPVEPWEADEEGPRPAKTPDDLLATALEGFRAPAPVSYRGGEWQYDATAAGASRRRAFASTQEHVGLAGLEAAVPERERALALARKGDTEATRGSVEALLADLGAVPVGREADERVGAVAAGARYVLGQLQSATKEDALSLLEAGLPRFDALRAERTLEALVVHVYSSGVLDPGDLPFADALLVERHGLSWAPRPAGASSTPFETARLEPKGETSVLRLAGAFAGIAEPLGLLHAEGLVYDAESFIANDRVRSGLVSPSVSVAFARIDDDLLRFVDLACRAAEQLPPALAGRPEPERRAAWSALARDLVPAARRNRLAEDGAVAGEWLAPSDLLRVGRRLALAPPAGLPEVPGAAEARVAWERLVARHGAAGARERLGELGPRPASQAGRFRLVDVDLPSYERLAEYRLPHLFSDRLYDLKVVVAREVVAAGDPASLYPLYLDDALDALLRRARMAWAFDWRALTGADRPRTAASRDDLLAAAVESGLLTRAERTRS